MYFREFSAYFFFCILTLQISAQQYNLSKVSGKETEKHFYGQFKELKTRSGQTKIVYESLKNSRSMEPDRDEKIAYAVYSGNFRAVQKLLSEGADINARMYPGCGPKGHSIFLALTSGSAAMTRLVIEKGGDVNYTLPAGMHGIPYGWYLAGLQEIADEMGRRDLKDILKSKKGLKGHIRNVGNLHEYFAFKPYSPDSSLKPVSGRPNRNDFTGQYDYPAVCRYTDGEFSYGLLKKNQETGTMVCDQRSYKSDKIQFRDSPFEVLYHLKPLKKNQEIVWEVPLPWEGEKGIEETYSHSFQPPDDNKVLKFNAVFEYYTVYMQETVFSKPNSESKESYIKNKYYHFMLTLVEFDSDSSEADNIPSPELNLQLLKAAFSGNSEAVKSALKSGADPNAQNKGWTSLMYAAYYGKTDVIRILLEYSADTNIKYQGYTALNIAEKKGNTEAAELLKPASRSLRPTVLPRSLVPEPSAPGVK
ncbi:MAG TPA: ankyrin repeat domain-containing protein [Leptospiraceae bacterium]|nr:ankyrin repeat domain-containing protein [Leptospiraceae bacterium]HNI95473.1 ankyrin repeat domain-containing protein [Leptospiraceae bacterium]HNM03495.1 ankyrin repeat domain-containing protein [Leptospiraceae bacterium]